MSQRTVTLAAIAALLPLTLAFTPRADAVRFEVEDGTKLSKELSIAGTFTMDGGTAYMMGEEQEIFRLTFTFTFRVVPAISAR